MPWKLFQKSEISKHHIQSPAHPNFKMEIIEVSTSGIDLVGRLSGLLRMVVVLSWPTSHLRRHRSCWWAFAKQFFPCLSFPMVTWYTGRCYQTFGKDWNPTEKRYEKNVSPEQLIELIFLAENCFLAKYVTDCIRENCILPNLTDYRIK